MSDKQRNIAKFFDDFNEVFTTFDGKRVAAKFSFPCLARSSAGVSRVFHNQDVLAHYFQDYLDDYRAKGCVRCRYSELEVTKLGVTAVLASVRWSLLDTAMAEVLSWRESYLLSVEAGDATAFATIDHA